MMCFYTVKTNTTMQKDQNKDYIEEIMKRENEFSDDL